MMNQTCKVCGEPAAGFHFGAFTCEGCKSFFGRSYNNLSSISECKNNGKCTIDKKNRTTCKACRLRKCYNVGMSKGGSRYGRRSNWFKIHCLLQEQQQQAMEAASKNVNTSGIMPPGMGGPFGDIAAAMAAQRAATHMSVTGHQAPNHQPPTLAYANYLPDMTNGTAARPFITTNALPFFNLMNPSPPSAFQVPPHLLFPTYHPATAYHHADLYKQRHSFETISTIESSKATASSSAKTIGSFSPHSIHDDHHKSNKDYINNSCAEQKSMDENLTNDRESPELCVAEDDGNEEITFLTDHQKTNRDIQSNNIIHNPIPIRLTPNQQKDCVNKTENPSSTIACNASNVPPPSSVYPSDSTLSSASLTFCSVSPVSVGSETLSSQPLGDSIFHFGQDSPIDLSMKTTTRSSSVITPATTITTTATASDLSSEISEESDRSSINHRRSFYALNTDSEMSESSLDSMNIIKRTKIDQSNGLHNHYNRSIFVCV